MHEGPLSFSTILLIIFLVTSFTLPTLAEKDKMALLISKVKPGEKELKIFKLRTEELDLLLGELQHLYPDGHDRLKAIADLYVGASYDTPVLVDADEEENWMPYTKTNCTMFVLFATAFLNSHSYEEALQHMKQLHYRNGIVNFDNRYHFTSDRITEPANKYFDDVTKHYVHDPTTLKDITLTLNEKEDGSLLFGDALDGWTKTLNMKYIPRSGFKPEQLKELPKTIGVAFVKRSNWKLGVIVGHEGLLIDGDLYHSGSSATGLHIVKDYLNIEFPKSSWEGLFLFSLNEVPL